jgi:hypothetical protein
MKGGDQKVNIFPLESRNGVRQLKSQHIPHSRPIQPFFSVLPTSFTYSWE